MPLTIAYSDRYVFDIGDHVFPIDKYRRIRALLISDGMVPPEAFVEPDPASWEDLARVHDAEYLARARTGAFKPSELGRLELPWSAAMVEAFRLQAGGTLAAARMAVASAQAARADGASDPRPRLFASATLGGGFHHAFADHGEGFCLFNDVAVAIRALQRDGTIARAAVVDVDVHQGNGTAAIFAGDPSVLTASLHQTHNYPWHKPAGSIDVGLPDGTGDAAYLHALEALLPAVFAWKPDLVFYCAGADPFHDDLLGGLNLTLDGLRGRDYMVFSAARDAGVPVAIVLAGGYARDPEHTAEIHTATIAEAVRLG